jgi:hypothetical protein
MNHEQQQVDTYQDTKEINSDLSLCASLAHLYLVEFDRKQSSLREDVRLFYDKNREVLLKIKADIDEIHASAKLWECKHWFGGTQLPLTIDELCRRNSELGQKPIPATSGLQKLCQESSDRGFKGEHKDFVVLMWVAAGRVLVTIRDTEQRKFNGAWITLIFDETSNYPRGGVQGQCGTKDELLSILEVSSKEMPELNPDENVSLF